MSESVCIDSNVPMYAAGKDHPFKNPSVNLLKLVAEGKIAAVTNSEVLQEILYRYSSIGKKDEGIQIFDLFSTIFPIFKSTILSARQLFESHNKLTPRDAIHLAVMKENVIDTVITYDKHFDGLLGIKMVTPETLISQISGPISDMKNNE